MQQRNQSLDALRGFAILAMVLSSSISFGILPAWMYHAQVPPPYHVFKPDIAGITWVDLVFPFFLFSMGAAIPLALNKKVQEQACFFSILYIAARRFLLLAFFALFTFHLRAWILSGKPTTYHYLLSITAFVLLFFQLYRPAGERLKKIFITTRFAAFAAAAVLLYVLPFKDGKGFSLYNIDIIILVLGNMAFFGTLIWWFTREQPWLRIGALLFVLAVFVASKEAGSWNAVVFNWSPLPWLYKFYYLKYLFIIVPGILAGDWLLQYGKEVSAPGNVAAHWLKVAAALSFVLVATNVAFLFGRYLVANLVTSALLGAGIYYCLRALGDMRYQLFRQFCVAGLCLLAAGLFLEAGEGGIKKDPSTYSYYFVTSGLAFFMLIGLYGAQLSRPGAALINYLGLNGRNPMVAYVTGNLLLIPLLNITGMIGPFNSLGGVLSGFLKGILFTGVVSLITVLFTKQRWLWKT